MSTPTLLVTGGSGHLGRRVLELLIEANAGKLITTTRTPEKLADLAARGVEVRQANFDDPASLAAAFAGVERLLLISTDALDRRTAQQKNAVAAAEQAGVKHVLYTSLSNAQSGLPAMIADSHYATEQALAASTLDWTVLRNNIYTDMFLGSLPRAVASGQLVAATGTGGAGYVTREDCARAAAAALANPPAGRTILDITGPSVVTHADLVQILSELTGRAVTYVPVDVDAIVAGMVGAGLPEPVARVYAGFDTTIAQGSLAVASNDVAELTGQAPQSVADFLTAHKAVLLGA